MNPSVLAVGAWLKNAACLVLDGRAHWSPVHGDLSDPAACAALEASVQALLLKARIAGAPVQAVAHDLHPDFFSTQLAITTADALGVSAIGVQHHHAHLAAVIAEHGIEGPVMGLALDGVGLGADGKPWGGELLWLDGPRWQRLGHLQPLALPGGDRAAREPWRMAASALHAMGQGDQIVPRFALAVGESVAAGVRQMLDKHLNCPMTSSAGRWFDAAAGALGLCHHQRDEAQAAIALEQAADRALSLRPDLPPLAGAVLHADGRIDLRPVLAQLFDATDADATAAGFHLSLADALAVALITAARQRGIRTAALGGGCFFNRILRQRTVRRLVDAGLTVYLPGPPGCGDAGLAVGQAWVAAHQLARPTTQPPALETVPCA
ncbi:MAG TPA: carbamoyltransferase HypF [Hydrogenophaga sp.]|uniref:Kae1-like domain-containing protein n=1 Tax=Hydrogenophaga sp. TaxID=1904254 RepID=UPI002BBE8897|nr:carbamoyltransferase HypF [Hydrogenophaga sp.]HMN91951.1 carbamoyltransferase HypF [Hydrogenophaga sp.]HMP08753.1 carbamoyltransferase HypF [Hydrogenophaga sp.]